MLKINDYSLYLVITEGYASGRSALEIAHLAISGGVDILQMREKKKTEEELIKLGSELSKLCMENGVIFIVNDDPHLAQKVDADGVHLGQEDVKRYSIDEARNILGKDKIIGLSTHSLEQFQEANAKDVDYIAFGPIFPTKTKDYFIGTSDVKNVLKIAKRKVFFIGGINLANIDDLLKEGAKNIALIRSIVQAEDIISNTRSFKEKLKNQNHTPGV